MFSFEDEVYQWITALQTKETEKYANKKLLQIHHIIRFYDHLPPTYVLYIQSWPKRGYLIQVSLFFFIGGENKMGGGRGAFH